MQGVEKPWFPVIAAGLVTSALTLAGVHFLNVTTDDFNIMGWYADGIIPVGAILVGLLAASGYGIVTWTMGIKVNKGLLWGVLGLLVTAYIAAQYIDYLDVLNTLKHRAVSLPVAAFSRFTFLHYLDMSARHMAWKGEHGDRNTPLGTWGYAFRVLEAAGFCLGGLITPLALAKQPFCDRCQRYMRAKIITMIPATTPAKLFQKADKQAQEAAMVEGTQQMQKLRELAAEGKINAFKDIVTSLKPQQKEANSVYVRYSVEMVRCPNCNEGYLRVARIEQKGKNLQRKELPEKVPLNADFVKALL